MPLLLHGSAASTFTRSARLALAEKGVPYELVPANLRAAEYAELHPWRKMPVLEHDGFRVYEAAAVMRYVDEAFAGPALQPADPRERARMTQWMSAINDYVAPAAVRGVLIPRFVLAPRGLPVDDAKVHASAEKAKAALAVFDAALTHTVWLAGDRPTLADWLLAPIVASGAGLTGADRYTDDLPHLAAWFDRVNQRPSFAATRPN